VPIPLTTVDTHLKFCEGHTLLKEQFKYIDTDKESPFELVEMLVDEDMDRD